MSALTQLVRSSAHCEQTVIFNCVRSPLKYVTFSFHWWNKAKGQHTDIYMYMKSCFYRLWDVLIAITRHVGPSSICIIHNYNKAHRPIWQNHHAHEQWYYIVSSSKSMWLIKQFIKIQLAKMMETHILYEYLIFKFTDFA